MGGSNILCPAPAIRGFQGGFGGKKKISEELKIKSQWRTELGIPSG